ncbi:uncharacterized protein B0H64DRAFT_314670 [Chaetomium fimeti]|uniref:Uncharacterized protein n=1 Tax=Chaetomium fimeti TaxID=1854472 RepID=A0AAE0HQI8_9PEZI|nr:hypothetical protein B0H64DRAFT_314670 [Chaetomium fimeti]
MPPPLPGHKQRRFPGLRVRPAQSYDFPLMARMANEIFQHERDIDYFDRHRSVKMGYEDEAMVADRLLAAETDWRLADMRRNRHNPGRHFFVATYFKQPAAYMTSLHDGQPREEILGWAEWQDPGRMAAAEPGLSDSLSDSDHSEQNAGEWQGKVGGALGQLASILKEIRLVHGNQELLVPPNGLAVSLPDTLGSFDEAAANRPDDWKRWSEELLPNCLGKHGDVHGRHLAQPAGMTVSTAAF